MNVAMLMQVSQSIEDALKQLVLVLFNFRRQLRNFDTLSQTDFQRSYYYCIEGRVVRSHLFSPHNFGRKF